MSKKGKVLYLTPNLMGMNDGINRIQPPLGPMISAAVIRENYGHDVRIHDTALEDWNNQKIQDDGKTVIIGQNDKAIAKVIDEYSPDVVGISVLFSNLVDSAHNIAKIVKEVNPSSKVVFGGNNVSNSISDLIYAKRVPDSNMPSRLEDLDDKNIDYAMWGEVDFAWPAVADAIINGRDISKMPGVVMRQDGLEYQVNQKPGTLDVKLLPKPARDLVNMEGYFNIGAFHSAKSMSDRVLPIMASRGCPEKCSFCTTPEMWGQTVRWRNTNEIIDEIKNAITDYNIGEIQFEDDTITANIKKLTELCGELEKIGLPWCTPNGTKVNYHQARDFSVGGKQLDMYKRMADSGCYQITLACESGSQYVLDNLIGKRLQRDAIKPAIENAKNAGMIVHTFWTVGYPRETKEQMEETFKFAEESGADSYSIAIVTPNPGTRVYREVMKNDLWWPGKDASWAMFRNSLIKVDGFDNPQNFEMYVQNQTKRLNEIGYSRRPELHQRRKGLENVGMGEDGARHLVDPKAYLHQS